MLRPIDRASRRAAISLGCARSYDTTVTPVACVRALVLAWAPVHVRVLELASTLVLGLSRARAAVQTCVLVLAPVLACHARMRTHPEAIVVMPPLGEIAVGLYTLNAVDP